jgi:hypothetical protein
MIALCAMVGLPLAILAYVLPGLALVRHQEWTRAEPVELAAIACAGSVAWWAVGLWFISFAGLGLSVFAVGSLAVVTLVVAIGRRSDIVAALITWRAAPTPALYELDFVIVVVGLRAIFAWVRLACSVGDISAHAYMAELIVMRDGLPDVSDHPKDSR